MTKDIQSLHNAFVQGETSSPTGAQIDYCAKLEEGVYAVAKAKQSEDDLLQELFHLFEIDERIYKGAENPNYAIDRTDVLAIRHLISVYGMKVRDQRGFLNTIRELVIQISSNY